MNLPSRTTWLKPAVMVAGAGGMMGQILLLREFMTAAGGNELTMGVVLANWLIFEAAGAWAAGSRTDSLRRPAVAYAGLLAGYGLALPVILASVGAVPRWLFGILPGEGVGMLPLLVSSLVLVGPASTAHGAMFPVACRIMPQDGPENGEHTSIGATYVWENLGTLLGGILLTLILVGLVAPVKLAAGIALVHILVSLALLTGIYTDQLRAGSKTAAVVGAVLLVALAPAAAERLHQASLSWQWPNQQVVMRQESPYGSIAVIQREGENTFFYDGEPVLTTPNPDTATSADFAHIAAASHPRPERVLVIGGGLGGIVDELLQHPVRRLTYVELDPTLPQVVRQFSSPVTERELTDPRVAVKHTDARLLLRGVEGAYDLVVLGFIRPATLQTNRLFTDEFFTSVQRNLRSGGVMAFSLPGSPTYMSDLMVNLNSSIYQTARETFPYITLIPGEKNIFLASQQKLPEESSAFADRLKQRRLQKPEFMSADYLRYRFDTQRRQWAMDSIERAEVQINRDFHPAGLLYALAHWGELFSPRMSRLLDGIRRQPAGLYFAPAAVLLAILLLLVTKSSRGRQAAVVYAVASTGMAAMAFDLLVLLMFQCLYGYVYQMAGLLVASFMGGIFLGGTWGLSRSRSEESSSLFFRFDAAVAFLLPVLYGLAVLLQRLVGAVPHSLILTTLALFSCGCGFTAGGQFPLAAAVFSAESRESAKAATAGILYSADLLGGWFCGMAVALVLFPVLGLQHTIGFLFAHKVISLLILTASRGGEVR